MLDEDKLINKLRSKKAWTATAMLFFFICKNYFYIEIEHFDALLNLILLVGTVWGIWINPEEGVVENEDICSDESIKPKRSINNLIKK